MEVNTVGNTADRPSHSVTSQIEERVREAGISRTPLRIVGRSHWLGAGRPVAADETVSVATLSGVVDYVPGDLTITVRAGTSLAEIANTARKEGQWLPIDPHGTDDGTIGATVATGSSGPLAHGFGTIRDLVLGVEVVTGEAKVIRGGGRVVKNVAGFDMVRLMTGSWGTLGVITELSLRLYALPANTLTMAMEAPTDPRRMTERFVALLAAPIIPYALELVSDELARRIGLPRRPMILIDLGGNTAAVDAQKDAFAGLGTVTEVPRSIWGGLRTRSGPESTVFRISGLPAGLAERWERARRIVQPVEGALMHASIGRGTVRCIVPGAAAEEIVDQLSAPDANDTVIFETLPPPLWPKLSRTAISDRVSQGIRQAFDPIGILNPGILGPTS
jgi:glycolate oxidase FAD binding subunit